MTNFYDFQAYYGGEARCDVEMGENFNPEELVCGGCSDIAKAQVKIEEKKSLENETFYIQDSNLMLVII
jgi:hypothetical protein